MVCPPAQPLTPSGDRPWLQTGYREVDFRAPLPHAGLFSLKCLVGHARRGAIRGYSRVCTINSLKRLNRRRKPHPPAAPRSPSSPASPPNIAAFLFPITCPSGKVGDTQISRQGDHGPRRREHSVGLCQICYVERPCDTRIVSRFPIAAAEAERAETSVAKALTASPMETPEALAMGRERSPSSELAARSLTN
jgi:hypothetical protein